MTDTAKPLVNKLREALQYALNRKEELCTYLGDPAVPMDNNAIERAMRPIAIGCKNYLFMGSAEGGKSGFVWIENRGQAARKDHKAGLA